MPLPFTFAFILLMFAFCIFYWAIAVGRWRQWAFSRVQDSKALYERAIVEHIIPENEGFMRKLELKSTEQRAFWENMQWQIEHPGKQTIRYEDRNLPDETVVYYACSDWWAWAMLVMFLGLGVYFSLSMIGRPAMTRKDWLLPIFTVSVAFFMRKDLWDMTQRLFFKRYPLLTINKMGIFCHDLEPVLWQNLRSAEVATSGYGKERTDFLRLVVGSGKHHFTRNVWHEYREEEDEEWEGWESHIITEQEYEAEKGDGFVEKSELTQEFGIPLENYGIAPAELEHRLRVYGQRFGRVGLAHYPGSRQSSND